MNATRRLYCAGLLLALLLGATSLSFWVATKNFAIADPVKSPRTAEVLATANVEGSESQVMVARYFASESNRAMFQFLGPLQLIGAWGALLLGYAALHGQRWQRLGRGVLVAAALLSLALAPLVPMMVAKGRAIDFVSRAGGNPPEVRDFLLWHGIYMAGDTLLFVASLVLLALLAPGCRDAAERSTD